MQYRSLAEAAASRYGVDSALIRGVIAAESGGNKDLVAKSGYTGLMQAGKGEPHKRPAVSIEAGTKKLRDFRVVMEGVLKSRGQRYDLLPEDEQLRLLRSPTMQVR
jgi:soluble lytic murein transglycosylase-like protein